MILDIGCGANPLIYNDVIHVDIDKNSCCLEIVADICHLPFFNRQFNIVYASHILEHLECPSLAIKELIRVSKYGCVIKVPNAKMLKTESSDEHIYSWGGETLRNFLLKYFSQVKIYGNFYSAYRTSKLKTLKLLVLSIISSSCELIAVCYKDSMEIDEKMKKKKSTSIAVSGSG